jgi:hypothetical protein
MQANAIWLGTAVLLFTLVVLLIEASVLWRRGRAFGAQSARLFGLTLVVGGVLFVAVAGFADQQTTTVTGVLATVAGYLLRSGEGKEE